MRRSSVRAAIAGAFAFAAALGFSRAAQAFCRTTTVSVEADWDAVLRGCWDQGYVLYWKNACVGYSIQRDASRQVSLADAEDTIASAFAKWTGTVCPTDGTGTARVSIDVRDLGPVDCGLVQYNQDQPNQHVIVFRDDSWTHHDSQNALALTTVTFDSTTGELYDADMEINTHDQNVTVNDPVPANGYDFKSIVTHETGHFLGMAHSSDRHATMLSGYAGGTSMRNLANDDVQGICSIYPPGGGRTTSTLGTVSGEACDPTPRHGYSTQCAAPKKGCLSSSIGARSPGTSGTVAGAAVALAALVLRRSRRRDRPAG